MRGLQQPRDRAAGDDPRADAGVVYLTLFVAGASERSQSAVANVKRLCEGHFAGAYALRVVDLYQDPGAALAARVFVAPTLIRSFPGPVRRFNGDLTDIDLVIARLDLRRAPLRGGSLPPPSGRGPVGHSPDEGRDARE